MLSLIASLTKFVRPMASAVPDMYRFIHPRRTTMTDRRDNEHDADVTASELAAFAYCAKAWHLERVLGTRASTSASRRRDVGIDDHLRHGTDVRMGHWLARHAGFVVAALVLVAVLLAVLAFVVG